MNWKKRAGRVLITGLLTGLLLIMGCGGKEQTEAVLQRKVVIGCDDYAPFSYTDENGNATGIDVELAKEAFRRLGYVCEFKTIDWEKKKDLVENGDIDCIWSCFSMDGREDEYHWAGPYMVSRQVIAVNVGSNIYQLQDLAGKTVAVQSTTKPESILLNHENSKVPQLNAVYSLEDRDLIYTSLGKGYVDAIAAHEISILQYMKDYSVKFRILDESILTTGVGVAFSKDDDRDLYEKLNTVLQQMTEDGTSAEILGKYVDNAEEYLEVNSRDNE